VRREAAAASAGGSPARWRLDRVPVAYDLRECLAHRYIMSGITDREGDLVARARFVSKHALDAID
jgi:hypothetical protein